MADLLAGAAVVYHGNQFNHEPAYRADYAACLEGLMDFVINIVARDGRYARKTRR